jgi:hypothetical protein
MIGNPAQGIGMSSSSCFAALLALCGLPAFAQDVFSIVEPGNANMTTGPEVGERIPAFSAADQNGVRRTFEDIVGPRGALILFHRSADW